MKHRSLSVVTVAVMFVATAVGPSQAQAPVDILISASVEPVALKEPGGQLTYSVRIVNTLDRDVSITSVEDNKTGDLDDEDGIGCFDAPMNMAPGEFASCRYTTEVMGRGGTVYSNLVTASGHDENGRPVFGSAEPRVEFIPRLIDLVIVKGASSPTPLNGIVDYALTVTNKGPDTATNVYVADPAPVAITYVTASPSQGSCNVSPSLITCVLGQIAAAQTVAISIMARATKVGSHTNVATVTGSGGRETSPADNVDDARTVVPQPLMPPDPPKRKGCLELTVAPKMLKADGKIDRIVVKVTAGGKRVSGARVRVTGPGVRKSARTNRVGIAMLFVNPRKAGLLTVSTFKTKRPACGPKRIGVVGVFLPPPPS